MDRRGNPQSERSRAPLGDATARVINSTAHRSHAQKSNAPRNGDINPLQSHPIASEHGQEAATRGGNATSSATTRAPERASEVEDADKRVSQLSTSSGASSSKRKTHIGPWQLGKTLGKGSAGRVRLARHYVTFEQVAVKILPKSHGQLTQAGSLAALDEWDRGQPEFVADNRIPLAIEREVAILKLIDHPNIMKLYDIWENRSEM
jgi:serine/threonine-protein kinase HSL1, negative regulator of Swe1 kinase